ncbi:MAG: CmpA/NrtA family ABC transporter substrate-binding protein [Pseudomonadota bacterium]|jgi:two-component system, oxyanion-binding sensor
MNTADPLAAPLPAAEKTVLQVGFMRLADAAPLIVAQECGCFARFGLEVELVREVSWANIRDRVTVGALDAGQMLAPMPLMTSLGVGGLRCPLLTGLVLNLNGNAITLAAGLHERLGGPGGAPEDPLAVAQALARRVAAGGERLTMATVYPFSTHTLQLRLWLAAGGLDPDLCLRLVVLPPEQMVDSLARGIIDGFCVGEPWNSVAVQAGVGVIAASGYAVWNNAPEKVLGVTAAWHRAHPGAHLRLRLALMEAARWLADPAHREAAAELLALPRYLDLPATQLLPALTGRHQYRRNGPVVENRDFLVFHRYQAGFPWRSGAECLVRQGLELLGRSLPAEEVAALADDCYRTDLYREAAAVLGWICPARDRKAEGEHAAPYELEPGVRLGPDLVMRRPAGR